MLEKTELLNFYLCHENVFHILFIVYVWDSERINGWIRQGPKTCGDPILISQYEDTYSLEFWKMNVYLTQDYSFS